MAKGGAFNVSQLIRELGLQTIDGDTMRVLETIQPTMVVGDLSDVTPPHVAPSAIFGLTIAGVVAESGTIEIQCLAPGGLFIEWIITIGTTTNLLARVTTATIAAGLPIIPPAGQTSRDPMVSVVRAGTIIASPLNEFVAFGTASQGLSFGPNPLFIPRGSFFNIQALNNNAAVSLSFGAREVPSSEHSPT